MTSIDASADLRNDPFDNRFRYLFGNESATGPFDDAIPFDKDLIATNHHDFADCRRAQQILQGAVTEDNILQVLFQHAKDQILSQLRVQVGTNLVKDLGKSFFNGLNLAADIRKVLQIQLFAQQL